MFWSQVINADISIGDNLDITIANLEQDTYKKGDIVATKIPRLFCDFNKNVSFNKYDSAFCSYIGFYRKIRLKNGKSINFDAFTELAKEKLIKINR